jgi:hypothetical protein
MIDVVAAAVTAAEEQLVFHVPAAEDSGSYNRVGALESAAP